MKKGFSLIELMIVIAIIAILAAVVVGLFKSDEGVTTQETRQTNTQVLNLNGYKVIEIDKCQYIYKTDKERMMAERGYGYLAHKGNCNNPVHVYNDRRGE